MPSDPRYPVGRFQRPATFTATSRAAAIAEIAAMPGHLRRAVQGLAAAQLDTPYRDGGWTVRQVVHHVTDAHLNAYIRTRLALTEDNPTIKPYDQDRWSALVDARTLPVTVSLTLITALHVRWVALLESLDEASFTRPLQHPESGPMTVDSLVAEYAWEGRHHVGHIMHARERNGW
jgi:hypothetical protein